MSEFFKKVWKRNILLKRGFFPPLFFFFFIKGTDPRRAVVGAAPGVTSLGDRFVRQSPTTDFV